MKNNTLSGRYCFKNPRFKQIFRIMRISTFLLMVCVFCSYAGNAHSQNAKVSIRMNNVKLDKILNEIENQTDYLFIYNNQVDINKITSVKVKNEAVAQVLDRILSGTGINYELEGTHIILTTEAIKDLHAQQQAKTVTGTVTDVSGEPIIGANIRIKGTTTIIRKSKFPQNPKRSVRFSGKRTKRSVQKRKARNTQKAETKVL